MVKIVTKTSQVIGNNKVTTVKDKIYVPIKLRQRVMNWYHYNLCHPGTTGLSDTLSQTMFWPGMVTDCKQFTQTCDSCQRFKKSKRKYPKNVTQFPTGFSVFQKWSWIQVYFEKTRKS